MANVKAEILILSTDNILSGYSTASGVNNVSKAVSFGTTERNEGFFGYPMKRLISEGGRMIAQATGFNGYVFGYCDSAGEGTLEFTLTGTELEVVVFYFNKFAGQWAIECVVDEGTADEQNLYSDDWIWAIKFLNDASFHTVKFTKWSNPNYSMCVTHIEALSTTLSFDNQWIDELNTTTQKTNDPIRPIYSVLPNYGDLSVIDKDRELRDYVADGIFPNTNFEISIKVNGTEIQKHTAVVVPYIDKAMEFNMEMTNKLSQWDNYYYVGKTITAGTSISAYDLLVDMITKAIPTLTEADVAAMCDTEILTFNLYYPVTVKIMLSFLIIPATAVDLVVSADVLRTSIEKICLLGQLQVYENDNGDIKFVNDRPYVTATEKTNAKVIPSYMQKSSLEYDVLLTNIYTDIILK